MKRIFLILSVIALMVTPMSLFAQGDDDGIFVTEDGSFAVFLPDGWLADGDVEALYIATSPETLELIKDDSDAVPVLDTGEVGIIIAPFPVEAFSFLGVEEGASLTEVLQGFLDIDEEGMATGEIMEVEVGGFPAAMVQISQDEGDAMIVIHRIGPGVVSITGIVVGDNAFDDVMEDVLGGLGNVNFGLPLEELYENEGTSVMYPADWTADTQLIEDTLVITNVPEFFDLEDAELQSGEVVYALFDVTDIAVENDGDLEATAAAFAEAFLSEGDEAGEPGTVVVQDREVAGLSVTNETEGEGEGGVAVTEGPDGQYYGIVYATADNEGDLITWTGIQILLSVNNTEGIEG